MEGQQRIVQRFYIFHQVLGIFLEEAVSGIPIISLHFQEFHSFFRIFGSSILSSFHVNEKLSYENKNDRENPIHVP